MVLRKALDVMAPSPLRSDRGTVALDPACIEVDAVSFARLAVNGNSAEPRLPLWVKSGSPAWASECPLLGVKRTLSGEKRTLHLERRFDTTL